MKPQKFHDPRYTKAQLKDLRERGQQYQDQMRQWQASSSWGYVHKYACKLEAIVELMESIYGFHIGFGIWAHLSPAERGQEMIDLRTIEARFASFYELDL